MSSNVTGSPVDKSIIEKSLPSAETFLVPESKVTRQVNDDESATISNGSNRAKLFGETGRSPKRRETETTPPVIALPARSVEVGV